MGFDVQVSCGYATVQGVNIDDILFVPVTSGYWKHSELNDDTYDLDDLMDILEVMQLKVENERRHQEFEEIKANIKR